MHQTRWFTGILLLMALSPVQNDVETLFTRMRERQGAIHTLQVRFTQEKKSSLLSTPTVSEGLLSYEAPDRVRWEYSKPDPYTILIEGDRLKAYYPTLHRMKTARITRMRNRIYHFLLATEPLEKLKSHFQVELRVAKARSTFTLVLTPLTPHLAKYIFAVTVQVDKQSLLPVEILIEEKDKDFTRLVFSDPKINTPLPEGTFALDIPPGCVVEDYQMSGR